MNYQILWLCKRLGHPERHLNESIAHYNPTEENTKSKILLKSSYNFSRIHGEKFYRK